MKSRRSPKPQRTYRQTARADAAAATAQTIIESFVKRLEEEWFEEITLDAIAKDSGVTVQTVIRRFGGKSGLLEAATAHMGNQIQIRRAIRPGNIDFTVNTLASDYELSGNLVLRLLAQEQRHPVLKQFIDQGRRGHREWLAAVFAKSLDHLTPAKRKARLDAMFVATSVPIWKLVRRDMGRPPAAFKSIVKTMLTAALVAE